MSREELAMRAGFLAARIGNPELMAFLYSQAAHLTPEVLEEFKRRALAAGVTAEWIRQAEIDADRHFAKLFGAGPGGG